jgi:hypothetical protein
MTPRSRKPVMLAIGLFGNADTKSYQNNISELLEESEEMQIDSQSSVDLPQTSSGYQTAEINSFQMKNLRSKSENDISSANDNGLPVIESNIVFDYSSAPDSLSSAFK